MPKISKKILIVEDERPLRNILAERLTEEGFEVHQATNGEDGLKQAEAVRPDLILLDIILPKLNGLDMLKRLRLQNGIPQPPVVMLSNLGDSKMMKESLQSGAQDYLIKSELQMDEVISYIKGKLKTR